MLRNTFFIFLGLILASCSHELPKRDKYSDKNMRIMVDPDSQISENEYFKLQKALVESDAFTVIDRNEGFKAAKKEQERQFRNQEDRFADKEKWAHWGKLYGVGAVLVPHSECSKVESGGFWHPGPRQRCVQILSLIDANSGEVITMVEGDEVYGDRMTNIYGNVYHTPEWTEVVTKLINAYPKDFTAKAYHPVLEGYRNLSQEEAIRQREKMAKDHQPASVDSAGDK